MGVLERLAAEMEAGRPAVLITVIAAPPPHGALVGAKLLTGPDGPLAGDLVLPDLQAAALAHAAEQAARGRPAARSLHLPAGEFRIYAEPYTPPAVLLIAGSGHVAQPVAAIGRLAGFRVVVLDDRPEYANRERFPTADQIIVDQFVPALRRLPVGPGWHCILVTRGHTQDTACLRELIEKPVSYLGMIGSRHRVKAVFELLAAGGVDPALFERVHSPIGLDLGGQSPGEIAVAIVAEVLKTRHGGTGRSLRERRSPQRESSPLEGEQDHG